MIEARRQSGAENIFYPLTTGRGGDFGSLRPGRLAIGRAPVSWVNLLRPHAPPRGRDKASPLDTLSTSLFTHECIDLQISVNMGRPLVGAIKEASVRPPGSFSRRCSAAGRLPTRAYSRRPVCQNLTEPPWRFVHLHFIMLEPNC